MSSIAYVISHCQRWDSIEKLERTLMSLSWHTHYDSIGHHPHKIIIVDDSGYEEGEHPWDYYWGIKRRFRVDRIHCNQRNVKLMQSRYYGLLEAVELGCDLVHFIDSGDEVSLSYPYMWNLDKFKDPNVCCALLPQVTETGSQNWYPSTLGDSTNIKKFLTALLDRSLTPSLWSKIFRVKDAIEVYESLDVMSLEVFHLEDYIFVLNYFKRFLNVEGARVVSLKIPGYVYYLDGDSRKKRSYEDVEKDKVISRDLLYKLVGVDLGDLYPYSVLKFFLEDKLDSYYNVQL